jgi:excisionase family DNA binding protein
MAEHLLKHSKRAYSILEVCAASGLGRSTVYQALSSGTLVASKVGRRTIITSDSFEDWISSLPRATFIKTGEAA